MFFNWSREKSMVRDAIIEAEREGIYFTEIRYAYNYYSGRLFVQPRYNSEGMRIW